jgi:hypothetical protein
MLDSGGSPSWLRPLIVHSLEPVLLLSFYEGTCFLSFKKKSIVFLYKSYSFSTLCPYRPVPLYSHYTINCTPSGLLLKEARSAGSFRLFNLASSQGSECLPPPPSTHHPALNPVNNNYYLRNGAGNSSLISWPRPPPRHSSPSPSFTPPSDLPAWAPYQADVTIYCNLQMRYRTAALCRNPTALFLTIYVGKNPPTTMRPLGLVMLSECQFMPGHLLSLFCVWIIATFRSDMEVTSVTFRVISVLYIC